MEKFDGILEMNREGENEMKKFSIDGIFVETVENCKNELKGDNEMKNFNIAEEKMILATEAAGEARAKARAKAKAKRRAEQEARELANVARRGLSVADELARAARRAREGQKKTEIKEQARIEARARAKAEAKAKAEAEVRAKILEEVVPKALVLALDLAKAEARKGKNGIPWTQLFCEFRKAAFADIIDASLQMRTEFSTELEKELRNLGFVITLDGFYW